MADLVVEEDEVNLFAFASDFFACLFVVVKDTALAYARESEGSFSAISLATKLRSINEKFRSKFIVGGGPGVLATLSGYSVSFPHFVTANRICFP